MTRYVMRGKDGRTVRMVKGTRFWLAAVPHFSLVSTLSGCTVRYGLRPGWAWTVSEASRREMEAAYDCDDDTKLTSLLPWEE